MTKLHILILAPLCGLAAAAAAQAPTGSPSNATATVSPATIAEAASRADAPREGGQWGAGVSLGSSIAGGDFGSQQGSRIWSTALGARIAMGGLRLTASIPWLRIRGRGLVFSGIDSTPVVVAGGTPGRRVTNDGWGDLTLGGSYALPAANEFEVELSGRVKLPVARDRDRVSTGKTDYSGGVQLTRTVGRFAPFVSATYRVFGDPATIDLHDGFAGSAGSSIALGGSSVLLLSYHYAEAASRFTRDAHELFAGGSTRIGATRLRATAFTTAGLSSGAAAASGGLSLAFDF